MEQITVTIPAQEYRIDKYMRFDGMCYLEEALYKAGFKEIKVGVFGETSIEGIEYTTIEDFDCEIVEEAFSKGEDIIVTLIKQN